MLGQPRPPTTYNQDLTTSHTCLQVSRFFWRYRWGVGVVFKLVLARPNHPRRHTRIIARCWSGPTNFGTCVRTSRVVVHIWASAVSRRPSVVSGVFLNDEAGPAGNPPTAMATRTHTHTRTCRSSKKLCRNSGQLEGAGTGTIWHCGRRLTTRGSRHA